jgi:O-antigen ligase
MGNPNNYAEVLVLTLPFFGAMVLNAKSLFIKALFILMAIPPFIALLFTSSRSGWISIVVALFVFIFFTNKKLIPVIILLGVLSIPLLPQFVYRRITTIWNPNDSSMDYRGLIYQTVGPMFKDFWKTGIGIGPDVFMKTIQKYFIFTKVTPPHTHNLFLEVWIEAGLMGIASFVWFLVRTVKNCILSITSKVDEKINNILIAGISSLAGICVMGLVEYIWFYPRVMFFFWLDIGLILAGLNILSKKREVLN